MSRMLRKWEGGKGKSLQVWLLHVAPLSHTLFPSIWRRDPIEEKNRRGTSDIEPPTPVSPSRQYLSLSLLLHPSLASHPQSEGGRRQRRGRRLRLNRRRQSVGRSVAAAVRKYPSLPRFFKHTLPCPFTPIGPPRAAVLRPSLPSPLFLLPPGREKKSCPTKGPGKGGEGERGKRE